MFKKRGKYHRFFSDNFFAKNHKAQVTIFIIIGVIAVGLISLFFVFKGDMVTELTGGKEVNPKSFLEICMEDKIKEIVQTISIQGGYMENPLHRRFKFEEEDSYINVSYLCYNQGYYDNCINQEPMLIQHLKRELSKEIEEEVENCFDELILSLKKKYEVVVSEYNGFNIELRSKKVIIEIDGEITLTRTEETSKYVNPKIITSSAFYDLALVAQEIVDQEAKYCNFNYQGYTFINPEFRIQKFVSGDSVIIYTIQHKDTLEKFRFAVRGCVRPIGI